MNNMFDTFVDEATLSDKTYMDLDISDYVSEAEVNAAIEDFEKAYAAFVVFDSANSYLQQPKRTDKAQEYFKNFSEQFDMEVFKDSSFVDLQDINGQEVGLEGIKETAAKWWKRVVNFLKRLGEKISTALLGAVGLLSNLTRMALTADKALNKAIKDGKTQVSITTSHPYKGFGEELVKFDMGALNKAIKSLESVNSAIGDFDNRFIAFMDGEVNADATEKFSKSMVSFDNFLEKDLFVKAKSVVGGRSEIHIPKFLHKFNTFFSTGVPIGAGTDTPKEPDVAGYSKEAEEILEANYTSVDVDDYVDIKKVAELVEPFKKESDNEKLLQKFRSIVINSILSKGEAKLTRAEFITAKPGDELSKNRVDAIRAAIRYRSNFLKFRKYYIDYVLDLLQWAPGLRAPRFK